MGFAVSIGSGGFGASRLRKTLLKHFGVPVGEIATAGRQFPITARVNIQSALEDLLRNHPGTALLGIFSPNQREPRSIAQTLVGRAFPDRCGPLQHGGPPSRWIAAKQDVSCMDCQNLDFTGVWEKSLK